MFHFDVLELMTRDYNDAIGTFDQSAFTSGCDTLNGCDDTGATGVGCGTWGMNNGGGC